MGWRVGFFCRGDGDVADGSGVDRTARGGAWFWNALGLGEPAAEVRNDLPALPGPG